MRNSYVYEPAWANAWPHLDDWFNLCVNMSQPLTS